LRVGPYIIARRYIYRAAVATGAMDAVRFQRRQQPNSYGGPGSR